MVDPRIDSLMFKFVRPAKPGPEVMRIIVQLPLPAKPRLIHSEKDKTVLDAMKGDILGWRGNKGREWHCLHQVCVFQAGAIRFLERHLHEGHFPWADSVSEAVQKAIESHTPVTEHELWLMGPKARQIRGD